jgi:transposase
MSKARLVITAVTIEKRPVGEVAKSYGVARSWIYTLLARYEAEGEAAFEPWSRRPKTSLSATSADTVDLIVRLRKDLAGQGLDAGPQTITWHLQQHHHVKVSPATVSRVLARRGAGHSRPVQAPQVVLHPLRGVHAERVLAVRLHPLPARRRGRYRDPDLARRPLPLRSR